MNSIQLTILCVILINVLVSIQGFRDPYFFRSHMLQVGNVLRDKDYKRLVTSSFLHAGWGHLIGNMIALYFFGGPVIFKLGILGFLVVYVTSMLVSAVFTIGYRLHDYNFKAVGSSGAVTGVVFASMFVCPDKGVLFFLFPLTISGYIFAIGYLLRGIYGMRQMRCVIGHTAYMAGALGGLVATTLLSPEVFLIRWKVVLFMLIPVGFLFHTVRENEAAWPSKT